MLGWVFVALASSKTVLEGAKLQLVRPAVYSPDYVRLGYPGGDVPADRGACVDVIIRALRYVGKDLQKLIHEDMGRRWRTYPRRGASRDRNIDHRRVPNQMHFFDRFAQRLPILTTARARASWRPGDLVYWKLPNGLDHCGVVTDRLGPSGLPTVIHNLSRTAEEDVVGQWKIIGHYRYPVAGAARR